LKKLYILNVKFVHEINIIPLGLERMRPDLGYAGASARKLFQLDCSTASDPKRLLTQLPELVRTSTQLATFKAGDKQKTNHQDVSRFRAAPGSHLGCYTFKSQGAFPA
jgi:hypothetical protein